MCAGGFCVLVGERGKDVWSGIETVGMYVMWMRVGSGVWINGSACGGVQMREIERGHCVADVSLFVLDQFITSPLQTTEGPSAPLDDKRTDGMAPQMKD